MFGDISKIDCVYIVCGHTDLRRGIDGLAQLVETQFQLDPFSNSLFLFCNRRRDRMKALLWEQNRFMLFYKRLENGGSFQWPRGEAQARQLSEQEFRWLLEGLALEQPKANKPVQRVQL